MKIYLFDTEEIHENLRPLSFTRPVADFRCGIQTIREKWEGIMPGDYGYYPVGYLRKKYGEVENPELDCIFVRGNLLPSEGLSELILGLKKGEALLADDSLLAFHGNLTQFEAKSWEKKEFSGEIKEIKYVFDIFLNNFKEIELDFERITKGRKSQPLPDCTRSLAPLGEKGTENLIFIEEGAEVECATINVKNGPVYIGKDASVMEGSCIRGPLAICEGSEVRMGAKIYGGTTIGPHCKVGGEIDNTVIFGYSNKAHDGYLGNAVIGEWCNIGAGVNASNLKNDYSMIRIWNYRTRTFMRTDLQFCGLIMGDHSKIGVNCMVNTATVIGVGVNLHGSGFPRAYLPSFCEGSAAAGFSPVCLKKFKDIAERVKSRRNLTLEGEEYELYEYLYESGENGNKK